MACASAFTPTLAAPTVAQRRVTTGAFAPLVGPVRPVKARAARVMVKASLKEKALTGATAAALTAAMMVPEIAEAADSGLSPSLKNFLLSIVSGGVVLGVLLGAVIAVANFDPVKRT
ncbi:hypothetical protein LUZ63_005264 [Rhynchospora breviuscula]|uniref:Photosystem II reaction center X protein n=1 Tax=Rhynchospora breviuscula TaxID=2022672 RepID=A0A9Q0CMK6_9POAL|nr:hypothetical protein LUZ63_005264 [Rhynchospora breviuscula]